LDLLIKRTLIVKSEGIQAKNQNPSLNRQLELLQISKRTYYYKPVIPFNSQMHKKLLDAIDEIHTQ